MAHVIRDRKKLLARVRRVGGQVAALEKALQDGADCADLLVQIAAAKGAMHGLMMEVLAGHLAEHVVAEDDAAGRAREAEVVLALMRSLGR